MIHINQAREIINSKQPFKCAVFEIATGDIIIYDNVVCTSSSYHNNSFNVKLLNSGQIRTFRAVTLFEINDEEVYL